MVTIPYNSDDALHSFIVLVIYAWEYDALRIIYPLPGTR